MWEFYYQVLECQNSPAFHVIKQNLAKNAIKILNDELNAKYWLFYGSLLWHNRGLDGSGEDSDHDIGMMLKDINETLFRAAFTGHDYLFHKYTSEGGRNIKHFQIAKSMAHMDIFVYLSDPRDPPDEDIIWSRWHPNSHPPSQLVGTYLPKSLIFPLQPATWMGEPVQIPHHSETILHYEYGHDFKVPFKTRHACLNNWWSGRATFQSNRLKLLSVGLAASFIIVYYIFFRWLLRKRNIQNLDYRVNC